LRLPRAEEQDGTVEAGTAAAAAAAVAVVAEMVAGGAVAIPVVWAPRP